MTGKAPKRPKDVNQLAKNIVDIVTGDGGGRPEGYEGRYGPVECTGVRKTRLFGNPDEKHVSTSYVERQNLTMRMHIRRFPCLTNGFSKNVENHAHAVALHFMFYNFCRIHQTLRVTPAMAAGVTDRLWDISDIAKMLEARDLAIATRKRGHYKKAVEGRGSI